MAFVFINPKKYSVYKFSEPPILLCLLVVFVPIHLTHFWRTWRGWYFLLRSWLISQCGTGNKQRGNNSSKWVPFYCSFVASFEINWTHPPASQPASHSTGQSIQPPPNCCNILNGSSSSSFCTENLHEQFENRERISY